MRIRIGGPEGAEGEGVFGVCGDEELDPQAPAKASTATTSSTRLDCTPHYPPAAQTLPPPSRSSPSASRASLEAGAIAYRADTSTPTPPRGWLLLWITMGVGLSVGGSRRQFGAAPAKSVRAAHRLSQIPRQERRCGQTRGNHATDRTRWDTQPAFSSCSRGLS